MTASFRISVGPRFSLHDSFAFCSSEYNVPVISEVLDVDFLLEHSKAMHTFKNSNAAMGHGDMEGHGGHHAEETAMKFDDKLRSFTLDAVKESFEDGARTVGFIVSILPWSIFFEKVRL